MTEEPRGSSTEIPEITLKQLAIGEWVELETSMRSLLLKVDEFSRDKAGAPLGGKDEWSYPDSFGEVVGGIESIFARELRERLDYEKVQKIMFRFTTPPKSVATRDPSVGTFEIKFFVKPQYSCRGEDRHYTFGFYSIVETGKFGFVKTRPLPGARAKVRSEVRRSVNPDIVRYRLAILASLSNVLQGGGTELGRRR